jgi:hypothetical protein
VHGDCVIRVFPSTSLEPVLKLFQAGNVKVSLDSEVDLRTGLIILLGHYIEVLTEARSRLNLRLKLRLQQVMVPGSNAALVKLAT